MPISADAVANYFIERSQGRLTHMQLQKLVYISHGYALASGQPLIENAIEAWEYGPVIPALYHKLKQWGAKPVADVVRASGPAGRESVPRVPEDYELRPILDKVYETYGKLSGFELSTITHRPDTPWSRAAAQGTLRAGPRIPDPTIAEHYKKLLGLET